VVDEFKLLINVDDRVMDPKNFSEVGIVTHQGEICIVPPNSFVPARTVEYFRISRDVLVICLGESAYARFS
jgi:dCTP deaminase